MHCNKTRVIIRILFYLLPSDLGVDDEVALPGVVGPLVDLGSVRYWRFQQQYVTQKITKINDTVLTREPAMITVSRCRFSSFLFRSSYDSSSSFVSGAIGKGTH